MKCVVSLTTQWTEKRLTQRHTLHSHHSIGCGFWSKLVFAHSYAGWHDQCSMVLTLGDTIWRFAKKVHKHAKSFSGHEERRVHEIDI